ncbi:obstructor-G [Carabus blaptoides fortunei]
MNALAIILVLVSAFGQLNARDPALTENCLNGDLSAKDCCALVPRAFYAHLKHPTNCGQFYHCAHGVPVLKDCPAGLHWSVKMDRCEWPAIAKCKSTATTTTTIAPTTIAPTTIAPTTISTAATEGTTTDGSGTNACSTATISNDCRYGKESADKCCVGVSPLEDALLPNPDNCGTYLQCVHEKPMVRYCPDGLHWSPDACRCEWPSIAKCI